MGTLMCSMLATAEESSVPCAVLLIPRLANGAKEDHTTPCCIPPLSLERVDKGHAQHVDSVPPHASTLRSYRNRGIPPESLYANR